MKMKCILTAALLMISIGLSAQKQSYPKWLEQKAVSPFKTPQVDKIIKGFGKQQDEENQEISEERFNGLSFEEKFNYTLWHPENYEQNCDPNGAMIYKPTKIYGYISDCFQEMGFSEKQINFLKENKSKIFEIIKKDAVKSNRIWCNYKWAIVYLEAYDQIPFIIDVYNKGLRKDNDMLALLCYLMNSAEYQPFAKSAMYKKLYMGEMSGSIENTKANQDLIISRAMAFYKSKQKK